MNTLKIQNNWHGIRDKLKEKYNQLSYEDLSYVKGQEDQLLARLEEKTGKRREALIEEINKM
ncbi:MAG: general stress protein CsbD [Bacteroidetes bacterium]|nr:general stress protein CsbD [Bacteroidota bacterium]